MTHTTGRRPSGNVGTWLALALAVAGCASHRGERTVAAGPPPRAVRAGGCTAGDTVLVGYGSERRCAVPGAVSSLDVGAARARGLPTLGEVLRGRVPGLDVYTDANGLVSLRVRGSTTFMGNSEPLLVLDGMPVQGHVGAALAAIPPQDVARVDVLRDATAAVYGSRGAKGVVLITTRKRLALVRARRRPDHVEPCFIKARGLRVLMRLVGWGRPAPTGSVLGRAPKP